MSYLKLSFAKKKAVINKTKLWTILCLFLILLELDIWGILSVYLDPKRWSSVTLLGFVLSIPVLILVVWAFYKIAGWIEKKMDAKMDIYVHDWKVAEKGDRGEELAYKELHKLLNSNEYQIYRNLTFPGVTSDFDIVVVGSKGIILFEVKNYEKSKDVYEVESSYYKSTENKLVKKRKDLREIVSWRAGKLEKYLAEKGVDNIKVRKVILYVKSDSVEIKEYGVNKNHVYIVQGLSRLQYYLANARADNHFTLSLCSKVNGVLKKL